MDLNQIISQISTYLVARLSALKAHIANVKTQLQALISQEAAARQDADVLLGERIDGVVADLTTETSQRVAGDASLDQKIDTLHEAALAAVASEATARTNADTALSNRINSEEAARIAADTALGGRIDSVESSLAAEVTARQSADSALQTEIDSVEASLTSAISAETTRATAAETALGSRIDSEAAARAAGDAAVLAQAIAASKMNVRKAFFWDMSNEPSSSIAEFIGNISGGLEDGAYQIFFNGDAQDQLTFFDFKNSTGNPYTETVSNGDIYYFNVSGGFITDGILADDRNQVKFDVIDSEFVALDRRVSATEAAIANLDATYATDSDVDSKILAAFTQLKNALEQSGYSDPN